MDPLFNYEINRSYELSLPTYICDNELIKLWVCCIWQRIKCGFIILLWNRPFLLNYATTNWYGSYSDEPSLWAVFGNVRTTQIAIWQWIKYGSIILLLKYATRNSYCSYSNHGSIILPRNRSNGSSEVTSNCLILLKYATKNW